MYPVEYAGWLLNPLRNLIAPAARIAKRLHLEQNHNVLEVGCGPGFFSPAVARMLISGKLTLFDAQIGMLQIAAERLRRRHISNFDTSAGSAENLPFSDETFDVVFMVTVLGEVPDRQRAVKEAARVLRRGGRLSITEAAGDPDRVKRNEVEQLARGAGLVAEQSWAGVFIETINYAKPNARS